MKYKIIDKKSYRLHLIQTDRFKSITIRVNLKDEIKKEEISYRNFLMDMLTYSTKNYKTKKELVSKSQDLYAVSIYSKGYRIGRYTSTNFYLSFLNEKYTESGMTEESIKLFSEVLFNPNQTNHVFDENSFNIIMKNSETMLKSIKDNPGRYSLIRMLENMNENAEYSYREFGYVEDLQTITKENLYSYYKKMMEKSLVDIYVIGEYDDKAMEQLIDKYLPFYTLKKDKKEIIIEHDKFRKKPQIVKEIEDLNQSKLSIGCKISTMSERERNYVISLYNLLLGGTGDSRFFKNIREKHSLCYYISSSVNKLDNILLIRSGINKNNFDKCLKLIKKEMEEIRRGNITDEEIEHTKSNYITLLDEIYDNQEALIETYIAKDLLNLEEIDERKEIVKTITKDEIIELAKKIQIDTIYLLEGAKENE